MEAILSKILVHPRVGLWKWRIREEISWNKWIREIQHTITTEFKIKSETKQESTRTVIRDTNYFKKAFIKDYDLHEGGWVIKDVIKGNICCQIHENWSNISGTHLKTKKPALLQFQCSKITYI
jgi:hypothetical protein